MLNLTSAIGIRSGASRAAPLRAFFPVEAAGLSLPLLVRRWKKMERSTSSWDGGGEEGAGVDGDGGGQEEEEGVGVVVGVGGGVEVVAVVGEVEVAVAVEVAGVEAVGVVEVVKEVLV
uniref:Uncharacterized protein n=1 Tax=Chromera velia CCMP2878 TaxID=1169474 RepID=A0A0G4I876_9ALVE|eukprot:Cvel_36633.t1-p1 / transcript=Cvel_36633.t1 / gene=Cvel_36633 / organism=Chromera_velia_CCMP2878 / gene_product=hypothetical protein / transcript_product=hypothetical protein / location=Cvel_scaffold7593:132-482(-) / protein_length=117 / sequence_SO=supercontig / SO=protein_coding / is_pseudo=false